MNRTLIINKLYTVPRNLSIGLGGFLLLATTCLGQIDLGDRSGGGLINSRIEAYFAPPQNQENYAARFAANTNQNNMLLSLPFTQFSSDQPFWLTHDLSAAYNFQAKHLAANGSETDSHSGTVGLFLDSQVGFSVKPTLKYSSADTSIPAGGSSTTYSVTPGLAVGVELLHFFREGGRYDPTSLAPSLVLAGNFAYSDSEKDSVSGAGAVSASHTTAWAYGGLASLGLPLRPSKGTGPGALLLTFTPSYLYSDGGATPLGTSTVTSTNSGVFYINSELDYALTKNVLLGGNAIWYHDVNHSSAPGQAGLYQDWGEFGTSLAVKLAKAMKVKLGYSYEAFNSTYSAHKALFQLDYYF